MTLTTSKQKKPSVLRQLIAIHHEQALRRKAIRQLAKAEWSFEFLTEVVRQAAIALNRNVEIEIESTGGKKIRMCSTLDATPLSVDDDIFNKLDDNTAIDQFIATHAPRR